MARQNDFEDTGFVTEMLPLYARQLYETMFKPDAPHATTHILARDYAKRTIDIALICHPDLLTDDECERITSPFTDSGIREWGKSAKRDEGFSPIQMDFENYTLKGLIKIDAAPGEHEHVKANVYWRIYDLGFTMERFGEIDKRISDENWNRSRYNEHPRKIDRYGKKYSWIAFYELAGFRQDNHSLPDRYEEGRISGADIDLFEKENGRRASITFRYGEKWDETQHFTYLRQDLLERYLAEIGGELIWVIWGERRQVFQNIDALYESLQDAPCESFQEVKAYCDIRKASEGS